MKVPINSSLYTKGTIFVPGDEVIETKTVVIVTLKTPSGHIYTRQLDPKEKVYIRG